MSGLEMAKSRSLVEMKLAGRRVDDDGAAWVLFQVVVMWHEFVLPAQDMEYS